MLDPQWRILLVQVSADITTSLHAAFADRAELVHLSAVAAVEAVEAGRSEGPAALRRPTLAILGPDVPAAIGLVHALRPDPRDLAAVLLTASGLAGSADKGTADPAAILALLVSPELARTLPCDQISRLPQLASDMLKQLDRERSYAASRAGARRGFAGQIRRQPGEYLFGSYLTQALISELLVRQDRLLHQLRATTDALQRPLLPPRLPTLPGLDLAALTSSATPRTSSPSWPPARSVPPVSPLAGQRAGLLTSSPRPSWKTPAPGGPSS